MPRITVSRSAVARPGFTLIELLVVIAIIAILAAILFPVFAQREKARAIACLNNEKQMGTATMMYTQDYDETLPQAYLYLVAGNTSSYESWDTAIAPYIKMGTMGNGGAVGQGGQVFRCPDDGGQHYRYSGVAVSGARSYSIVRTALPLTGTRKNMGPQGLPLASINAPAGTILYAEWHATGSTTATGNVTGYSSYSSMDCPDQALSAAPQGVSVPAHNGGWNYTFCDGHSKWMKPERTAMTTGVAYPVTDPQTGGTCSGTTASPCGMWTINDQD